MTTQMEVAEAFVNGDSAPNVASNYRRLTSEDGSIEYLCGGRNGREIILAKKEPLDQFTVYLSVGFGDPTMRYGTVRRQARSTRRWLRRLVEDMHGNYDEYMTVIRGRDAPKVEDIEDIE